MKFTKLKNSYYSLRKSLIPSISIAGIFVALILIIDFAFEQFKVWNWSMQVFLIVYSLGIYKIKNIVVNICFLISVPILIFMFETNPYIINPLQAFYEYFLVFYVFSIFYLINCVSNIFASKKKFYLLDIVFFISTYSLLIVLKYFLHTIASLTWFGENFVGSLIYNLSWLLTNLLTIPIAIAISPFIISLFNKMNNNQKNKYE